METVKQLAKRVGVSVRTLHYYDAIGLLPASSVTQSGYRLYDEAAQERLIRILLYRELGFSLKQIGILLDAPAIEQKDLLQSQRTLMEAKKAHLEKLIFLTGGIKQIGVENMTLEDMDIRQLDDNFCQAKALWGNTDAWRESQERCASRPNAETIALGQGILELFKELGAMKELPPESAEVQAWVPRLQQYITRYFYRCTDQILLGLGELYAVGGSMTANIDGAGGTGTGAFAREAIRIYFGK